MKIAWWKINGGFEKYLQETQKPLYEENEIITKLPLIKKKI